MIPRSILLIYATTGMCSLVYQMLWIRWLGLALGNFATATAAVVAIFMAGLALGNLAFGRVAARIKPAEGLKLYATMEGTLAGLAALSPLLLSSWSPVARMMTAFSTGLPSILAACGLLLLPPTVLMGGTMPVLVRAFSAGSPPSLGRLYAVNTLGGMLGPLLAAFLLMPVLGLSLTMWAACVVNAVAAYAAYRLFLSRPAGEDGNETVSAVEPPDPGGSYPPLFAYTLAGASGFLALGMEIVLTRQVILTVTGGSVYGLALVLSAYLGGMTLGAWLVRRYPPRGPGAALRAFAVAQALVWVFVLTTPFWDRIPALMVPFWLARMPFEIRMLADFALVFGLLVLGAAALGYALPALAGLLGGGAGQIGALFGANTLGSMAGAVLGGFVLLPALGLHLTLMALGSLAILLALVAGGTSVRMAGRPARILIPAVAAPFLVALTLACPEPDRINMSLGLYNRPELFPSGMHTASPNPRSRRGNITFQQDGPTGRIAVWESDPPQLMSFLVNGKPDGSNGISDLYTQIGSVHFAALSHPAPRRALVIGLGTGISAGSLAKHREVGEIRILEIEPAMLRVARLFREHNGDVLDDPKVRVSLDDARHFLGTDDSKWDLVFSEPSNLFVSGMVNLYTVEFYRAVRNRLAPGGVFLQWIHYYQMHPADVQGALKTFQLVFPDTTYWINPFGDSFALGSDGRQAIDVADWLRRASRPEIAADLKRIGLVKPLDILGFFLWGPGDLARYAGKAAACTDDFPFLEFTAPRTRWSKSDSLDVRLAMQAWGPLEPMPLSRETASLRVKLGDLFRARHSIERSRAEYRRALELEPGSRTARRGLAAL
jgi:spermidine synthase